MIKFLLARGTLDGPLRTGGPRRIQGLAHARVTSTIREVTDAIAKDLEVGCIATVTDAGVRVRRLRSPRLVGQKRT